MRSTQCVLRALTATPILRFKVPKSPQEEKEHFEKMEREAQERGFGRRDSGDDKIFMDRTFHAPDKIDGVAVANLPAKEKEETEFDKYELSTADFTSIVMPHGKEISALGAGFGARPDKRLGWLRPRQTVQPYSSGATSITPKYDENGMPVDETLSRDQLMKKRMDYLKSIEGTTMSHKEHFLLVDLDFEKDAVLFGNTRGEFEMNVIKLKNVIIAYNKWERTDNFYYYSTILLKFMVVWVLIECLQQYYDLRLFENNYDTFAEVMEKEIAELADKRDTDLALAREQLRCAKPNFVPVVAAIVDERDRVQEDARAAALAAHESMAQQASASAAAAATVAELAAQLERNIEESGGEEKMVAAPAAATPESLSALYEPKSHPMDTMGDAAYTERLHREEQQREMRRLYEHASKPGEFSVMRSVWRKLTGGSRGPASQPLQQEDFARFSYAASPTSIEAMRAVRRTLLPRSEDYTQLVREEMFAHKLDKANHSVELQSDGSA